MFLGVLWLICHLVFNNCDFKDSNTCGENEVCKANCDDSKVCPVNGKTYTCEGKLLRIQIVWIMLRKYYVNLFCMWINFLINYVFWF